MDISAPLGLPVGFLFRLLPDVVSVETANLGTKGNGHSIGQQKRQAVAMVADFMSGNS